jgi:putative DNA-invertase from lambdoid prophage Rac
MAVPVEVHFVWITTLPHKSCGNRGFPVAISERVHLGQSAAIYCRVSTADQSCARQERDLKAFAKKAGYRVVGVWKETASGAKDDRKQRKEVLALAQARKVDVILVTELTRWGRSMLDLLHTLQDLQAWNVSLVAQIGLQLDLRSAQGKLIASLMAALAEFERDLLRERVRSGIAAARKRGVRFGRQRGYRPTAARHATKVLKFVGSGQSYREISHRLGISKNTVLDIVKRQRAGLRQAA